MNMKNKFEIHIYTASFGNKPNVLIDTTPTFVLKLLKRLENSLGKKETILIRDEQNLPWLALNMDKLLFYVWNNQILKLCFS